MNYQQFWLSALVLLVCRPLPSAVAEALPSQPGAAQAWEAEYGELQGQIQRLDKSRKDFRERLSAEALDAQALIWPGDRDPLDVVLRRTRALVQHYRRTGALPAERLARAEAELARLTESAKAAAPGPAVPEGADGDNRLKGRARVRKKPSAGFAADPRSRLFLDVCALRRRLAFANPLLNFDSIVCMLEQPGNARIIEQARACFPGHVAGGGPVLLRNFKGDLDAQPLLKGAAVSDGPWQGKELTGKFSGLELTYDADELLFAATTDADVWHVFRFKLGDRRLAQLTDGPCDDFDPYLLPSGRIVFTSTRRGGIGRCLLTPKSLTYTLYSMEGDGGDVVPLSYHETNEWAPVVTHDGKIAYTRWDYVDRHWGTAHHYWECYPDGRDPRNFHGNYPLPYWAIPEGVQPEQYGQRALVHGRFLRPDVEISFRPIGGSHKLTATAVGHHEGFSGSLVLLDPRVPDDGRMAQLKRITPEYFFPEVEPGGAHAYGTAWPLSEDFYLCNFQTGLYLLDRYGNRELIYESPDSRFRVRDPFPLRSRPRPPVLPVQTWQGKREALPDHHRAVISVGNVYAADDAARLPPGVKVKWMRIVQVIPQLLERIDRNTIKMISYADDSIGRMPLGIVPVEEDGSVYCEAPVGKALYFQLLDAKGMAVHSMRSATYVHPGEHLSCLGCHEDKWRATASYSRPLAMQRPPSKLTPEIEGGAVPFNFIKLVKEPVFDKACLPCHSRHPKAPDLGYASLARNDRAFSYPGEPGLNLLGVGGSRTTPGRFGAHVSGLMKILTTRPQHKDLKLTDDQWRRITLWLDLNSNEVGWIGNDRAQIAAQKQGQALWPPVDVDPGHPTGVERDRPVRMR